MRRLIDVCIQIYIWLHIYSMHIVGSGCGQEVEPPFSRGQSSLVNIQVSDPLLGLVKRSFRLHIPLQYNKDVPTPLVLDFHGVGGNSLFQEKDSNFTVVADEDPDGFIVITPNGMTDTMAGKGSRTFNCSKSVGPQGSICDTNRTKYEQQFPIIAEIYEIVT
ncbi:uncharacterized protein LOC111711739 [Eurytemora carolleeae]|uniref:uncharacterized protein LOC111711739 n=1 Tax=Eurytemora carolleeae TaxID=1294199 RepID=UPI000C77645F|nr:uncharacterized protein LOC111711739 [Eurytemora carolleeae]|eukprot:XP_023341933.1 uncharacterized protein LOC111711739 [Eurytemora affinis]